MYVKDKEGWIYSEPWGNFLTSMALLKIPGVSRYSISSTAVTYILYLRTFNIDISEVMVMPNFR